MPANTPDPRYYWCWACLEPLEELHRDYSLDGTHLAVCENCWESMTVADRLFLQLLARPRKFGGLGLVEAIDVLTQTAVAFGLVYSRKQLEDEDSPDSAD